MTGAAAALPVPTAPEYRVEVVSTRGLRALTHEWQELADSAAEPNPFYEPWMVLPALEAFHPNATLKAFLVWEQDESGQRRLAALFPLVQGRLFEAVRYRLLRYYYCSLCTPLVRSREALHVLLDNLNRNRDGVCELALMHGDGPVCRWLTEAIEARGWRHRRTEVSRAFSVPYASAETYLQTAVKGARRRDLKRMERRLAERGSLVYDELPAQAPVAPWIDEFLALEAAGWKGKSGSALAKVPNAAGFLHRVAEQAQRRGRLSMSALRLDGRAIAMNCHFRGGTGLYAFRSAYSEVFARHSPGILLLLHDTLRAHESNPVRWIDSCAAPDSTAANHLWRERRRIVTLKIAPRASLAGLLLAATGVRSGYAK